MRVYGKPKGTAGMPAPPQLRPTGGKRPGNSVRTYGKRASLIAAYPRRFPIWGWIMTKWKRKKGNKPYLRRSRVTYGHLCREDYSRLLLCGIIQIYIYAKLESRR